MQRFLVAQVNIDNFPLDADANSGLQLHSSGPGQFEPGCAKYHLSLEAMFFMSLLVVAFLIGEAVSLSIELIRQTTLHQRSCSSLAISSVFGFFDL